MSNRLDPDQAQDIGPDLDLKSLQSEKMRWHKQGGPNMCSFTVNTGILVA